MPTDHAKPATGGCSDPKHDKIIQFQARSPASFPVIVRLVFRCSAMVASTGTIPPGSHYVGTLGHALCSLGELQGNYVVG